LRQEGLKQQEFSGFPNPACCREQMEAMDERVWVPLRLLYPNGALAVPMAGHSFCKSYWLL